MPLADVDEIEDDASEFQHQHKRDFACNKDDLTSGHQEYLDCDSLLISFIYFQRKVKR
jgi:hypothetical protein